MFDHRAPVCMCKFQQAFNNSHFGPDREVLKNPDHDGRKNIFILLNNNIAAVTFLKRKRENQSISVFLKKSILVFTHVRNKHGVHAAHDFTVRQLNEEQDSLSNPITQNN